MSKPRLVEVECIDHVIEQLKHVRDNYEGEYDEQGAELNYAIRQRDELLAALEQMLGAYSGDREMSADDCIEACDNARAAIAKIWEGE